MAGPPCRHWTTGVAPRQQTTVNATPMRMQHPRPFLGREYVKQRLSALLVSAFLSLECSRTRCPPPSFLVIVRSKQRADVSYLPTFRTHFCVFENFLLETHTVDDLPAKEG